MSHVHQCLVWLQLVTHMQPTMIRPGGLQFGGCSECEITVTFSKLTAAARVANPAVRRDQEDFKEETCIHSYDVLRFLIHVNSS